MWWLIPNAANSDLDTECSKVMRRSRITLVDLAMASDLNLEASSHKWYTSDPWPGTCLRTINVIFVWSFIKSYNGLQNYIIVKCAMWTNFDLTKVWNRFFWPWPMTCDFNRGHDMTLTNGCTKFDSDIGKVQNWFFFYLDLWPLTLNFNRGSWHDWPMAVQSLMSDISKSPNLILLTLTYDIWP